MKARLTILASLVAAVTLTAVLPPAPTRQSSAWRST
jgi:hypothetical protein